MAIPNNFSITRQSFDVFCDKIIILSLCLAMLVLPASIAFLNSFAALAIFFYLLKKINRILIDWPLKTTGLKFPGKAFFVWNGFAPPVNFLNSPLKFLALAVFISVVFSQFPGLSFAAFLGKFLKSVFLYFCFIEVFGNEKRIWIFVNCFLLSAFITALSGAIEYYTGHDFLKKHLISGGRINSFFYTANGFGAYLLPVFGLTAHLFYTAIAKNKSWFLGIIWGSLLILLLACLCWTYSRSSWIGYLVILFVMTILDMKKLVYAGILCLVFIFIFLPSLSHVRHLHLINDHEGEIVQCENSFKSILEHGGSGRINFWSKAVSIIRTSPLYGTGLNTYARVIKRDPNPHSWWYAHNCYLQLTAETGILGLGCFLSVLCVLIMRSVSCCQMIEGIWSLTLLQGMICGLCGFLVQSFFDNTFYTVQLGVLMWLIFGLTVAITRLKTR